MLYRVYLAMSGIRPHNVNGNGDKVTVEYKFDCSYNTIQDVARYVVLRIPPLIHL